MSNQSSSESSGSTEELSGQSTPSRQVTPRGHQASQAQSTQQQQQHQVNSGQLVPVARGFPLPQIHGRVNPDIPWERTRLYREATRLQRYPGEPRRYEAPRRVGRGPHDVTGFIPGQRTWHKNNLPEILYMLNPPESWRRFKEEKPGPLLDEDGEEVKEPFPDESNPAHPRTLRDIPILPNVIGSQEEEWYFEAVRRLDPRIRWSDIAMRMPAEDRPTDNALQWRLSRGWREALGMMSWHLTSRRGRAGDDLANDRVMARVSAAQERLNTTRGLTPGLINPRAPRTTDNWVEWPKSKSGKDWGLAENGKFNRRRPQTGKRKKKSTRNQEEGSTTQNPYTRSQGADGNSRDAAGVQPIESDPDDYLLSLGIDSRDVSNIGPFGNSQAEFGGRLPDPTQGIDSARNADYVQGQVPIMPVTGSLRGSSRLPPSNRGIGSSGRTRPDELSLPKNAYINPFDGKAYDRTVPLQAPVNAQPGRRRRVTKPTGRKRPVEFDSEDIRQPRIKRPCVVPSNSRGDPFDEGDDDNVDLSQPRGYQPPRAGNHPNGSGIVPSNDRTRRNPAFYPLEVEDLSQPRGFVSPHQILWNQPSNLPVRNSPDLGIHGQLQDSQNPYIAAGYQPRSNDPCGNGHQQNFRQNQGPSPQELWRAQRDVLNYRTMYARAPAGRTPQQSGTNTRLSQPIDGLSLGSDTGHRLSISFRNANQPTLTSFRGTPHNRSNDFTPTPASPQTPQNPPQNSPQEPSKEPSRTPQAQEPQASNTSKAADKDDTKKPKRNSDQSSSSRLSGSTVPVASTTATTPADAQFPRNLAQESINHANNRINLHETAADAPKIEEGPLTQLLKHGTDHPGFFGERSGT